MSRPLARAMGLGLAVATVGLWLALDGLTWPARAFATALLGPLPAAMVLQTRLADHVPREAEREEVYISSSVAVWVLAAVAMLAARYSDLSRSDLWIVGLPLDTLLLASGLTTLAGVAIMAAGKIVPLPESPLVDFLIPRATHEKIAFVGLSISAGIAEELVFRSFLIGALAAATGSLTVAVAVSVAAFAVSHAYQGLLGVARVALLGGLLTAPFLLTGSVYPSMIAHAALDVLAGLVLADWLKDDH